MPTSTPSKPASQPSDDAMPPRSGRQKLAWAIIWVAAAVSGVGVLALVYQLARNSF